MDLSTSDGGRVVHGLGVRRIHPSDVMVMSKLVPLMLCRLVTGGTEDVGKWEVGLTDVLMGREDLWFIERKVKGSNHDAVCGYARGGINSKASEYQLVVCLGGMLINYDPPGWRIAIYEVEQQIRMKGMMLSIRLTVWSTTVKAIGPLEGHIPVDDHTYYLPSPSAAASRQPSTAKGTPPTPGGVTAATPQ